MTYSLPLFALDAPVPIGQLPPPRGNQRTLITRPICATRIATTEARLGATLEAVSILAH
jgi:hypothetical protein